MNCPIRGAAGEVGGATLQTAWTPLAALQFGTYLRLTVQFSLLQRQSLCDCTGCGIRGPQTPGNGECAGLGVPGRRRGARWDGLWRTCLPAITSRGCGPESPKAQISVPSDSQSGSRAGNWNLGVLSLRAATSVPALDPLWAALRPQPRVPRQCGDHGQGSRGTILTRAPGFVGGRTCGLWRSLVPPFSPGGARFLLSFPNIWEAGSQIHDPVSPSHLPTGGSKSLNFQVPPRIPKRQLPSSIQAS